MNIQTNQVFASALNEIHVGVCTKRLSKLLTWPSHEATLLFAGQILKTREQLKMYSESKTGVGAISTTQKKQDKIHRLIVMCEYCWVQI